MRCPFREECHGLRCPKLRKNERKTGILLNRLYYKPFDWCALMVPTTKKTGDACQDAH